MQTFKEFNEAMTMAQRMKAKATFRKNRAKIKLGRKKAAKKLASPEKLKGRAEKKARNILMNKILRGKTKNDLSYAACSDLERKLEKKKGAIKRIAKKLLPAVKKADRDKLKKNVSPQ